MAKTPFNKEPCHQSMEAETQDAIFERAHLHYHIGGHW